MMCNAINFFGFFVNISHPSIEGDTPFKSSKSPNEIFCHEITNEPKTKILTDIKEQLHYETWREVEEIYRNRVKKAEISTKTLNEKTEL